MSNSEFRDWPFVSVVVPCFNAEDVLPAFFASMHRQSFPSERFEIICVDNGSSDGTRRVIEQQAESSDVSIRYVAEFDRVGSYAARNKGVASASGEMLFFTDADCRADPDWLSEGVKVLSEASPKTILGGNVELTAADAMSPTAVEMFEMILGFSQKRNVEQSGYTVTANLMCRRTALEKVGKFNDQLLSKGDYEWCTRALRAGYELKYVESSKVVHQARRTLKELMIKTRRVTGGQLDIRTSSSAPDSGRRSARSPAQQLALIARSDRFPSLTQKLSVMFVAGMVFTVKVGELLRLQLGGRRERR